MSYINPEPAGRVSPDAANLEMIIKLQARVAKLEGVVEQMMEMIRKGDRLGAVIEVARRTLDSRS